jgi:hypothetical protein
LNWVEFDDQLNYVNGGVVQVPQISGGQNKQVLQASLPMAMPKNGYVYIYVSNESQDTVYFNNLDINYRRGPVTEEEHYYPFGLTMAGISDEALAFGKINHYKYNKGSELEEKSFIDGSGLQWYDTHFRELDPQIGRWNQIDPKCEAGINPDATENEDAEDEADIGGLETMSPYASMGNDPIKHNDPNGDIFGIDNLIGAAVGAVVEIGTEMATNALTGQKVTNISWGKVGVAAAEGLVTDGASNVAKVLVKVGAAVANSLIDNHDKGVKEVAKGAAMNLGIDAVAGGISKLAKGVGAKALNKVADKMVSSNSSLTKVIKNAGLNTKTAGAVAKVVQQGQKALAKEVKNLPKTLVAQGTGATIDQKVNNN